jgi:hypothetical protein
MNSKDNKTGVPITGTPEQPQELSLLSEFDLAELENQKKRHKSIGTLFDKAAEVIENYLDDPNTDLVAKMFPARLAADLYLAQEKFKREDEKIEIEKRKLVLDEIKSGKPLPPGSKFIQNNNYYQVPPQQQSQPVDIGDLKKRQEELLSGYLEGSDKPEGNN